VKKIEGKLYEYKEYYICTILLNREERIMKRMKRLSFLLAFMLIFTSLFANPFFSNAEGNEIITITVLGTSDMHGAVNSWSYESGKDSGNVGLSKIHSIVKQVKAENPNTLVIDNGDTVQGSIMTDDLYNADLSKPQPMIDMMNFVGYDAMTLGNHEFNFGLPLIDKMVEEAKFPIISANTYKKEDGSNYVKPYTIKDVAGVKVGILGLTVPSIPRWDGPKVESLEFKHMAEEAKKYVKILKEEEGVDVIIASAHSGLDGRHEDDGSDSARNIALEAPEIAVLLLGHDHSNVNETINGVLVGAPVAKYGQSSEVVRFDINLQKEGDTWSVTDKKVSFLNIADYEASAEAIEHAKSYHEATLEFIKNPIGKATDDFHPASEVPGIPEAQVKDTAVIDLINEVQLKYTEAEIAAAALFKSGSNLPKGDINFANVFDIYKYANKLVGVEVTGKELKDYMEWSASYYNTYRPGDVTISFNPEIRGYNYDMFTGVEYKIDIAKPAGERIVDLTFKGKAIDDEKKYKLAINDYRYSGLKSKGIISGEAYFNSDPVTLRSYIKEYIKEKGTIKPDVDNNWEVTGADLNHPLRDTIVELVKSGEIEVPKSKDGRTPNVKSLNVYDLIKEGKIPQDKLDKFKIDYTPLTIVHTNDTHSRIEAGKYAGMGFAKIATKVKQLREKNPNVLVVDAGDTFHGQTIASIVKGESIVKVMNAIGYDAMAPGNHDFNYGQERLVELEGITDFPILAANVIKEDGKPLLKPYIIKEVGGLKVGIFGLATPDTTYMTHPKNVEGLTFNDPIAVAKEMIKELEDKADIIVALTHLGLDESSSVTSVKVAEEVKGIDIMVDGHSHTTLPEGKKVNDTLIVQTGEYDKNLGIVDLVYEDGKIKSVAASLLTKEEAAELAEDEAVVAVVADIKAENEKVTSVVVGKTDIHLDGERADVRTGETNLGNLIASAMLKLTEADIAFTNGGGIRASIETGEITKGEVITVLPFGNYVVVKEMKGSDIWAALEHGIDSYPEAKGAFPHVAGMTFEFDPSKEAGSRLVKVMVGEKPLDPEKTYKFVTNDFLAAGGDGYKMFADDKILGEYPGLDEVLIEHIQKYGTEDAKVEGRAKVHSPQVEVEAPKAEVAKPEAKVEIPEVKVATPETKVGTYVVKEGDVLWKVAEEFGVTWQKLAEYNKLKNPNFIISGQKLLVPAQ